MRLANVDGRAVLLTADDRGVDVESASGGKFGPGLPGIYEDWKGFRAWAESADTSGAAPFTRARLGSPSPEPRQIVAVGLNYREHAAESGFAVPDRLPPVFTKFDSSLSGPDTEVVLPPGGHTDWEVELVVVIGERMAKVRVEEAWDHVAGLTVGQDLSERVSQLAGPAPQFSLGKSYPGFAPVGPWLVTPDSVPDKDDLELGCSLDGEVVQQGRTKDLIFPVAELLSKLSQTIVLHPGDLVFTGTPAGVGQGRQPQRFIRPGEKLHSWIEGIGELNQTFTDAREG
ncbi:2-keto-4-pentenoate hydratase/2-oxohepta-3-ene-1,7-dioic acid hydratase (catechol pathway) [Amycolatopsis sacchari]|uniref:2-keto-4-pentenoate hydratase/2-oxohepta-3-ene-1,7-dioic acid hydratase (Catechol pathway) n=1 Tax=Amycolatopsis sacchari TaxID=115433 RepID=A0A1I4C338_9PSEU|nr:fumarylacetoacetate hydrolase family protein [Amycolatopsis sacchari]SFK75504.1 2-keto-4-pentenoate hydratase/2-oxohepta-3-ene-1,7-dioic acid hydratase (catechol pathway) [Amycolatopsis sacchari]